MIERRRIRSDDPTEALQLLLETYREALDARTLVIGTPCGRLIAGAGRDVGAVAAYIVEDSPGTNDAIATWRMRAGDRDVVIASVGGRLSFELGESVRRIARRLLDSPASSPQPP